VSFDIFRGVAEDPNLLGCDAILGVTRPQHFEKPTAFTMSCRVT